MLALIESEFYLNTLGIWIGEQNGIREHSFLHTYEISEAWYAYIDGCDIDKDSKLKFDVNWKGLDFQILKVVLNKDSMLKFDVNWNSLIFLPVLLFSPICLFTFWINSRYPTLILSYSSKILRVFLEQNRRKIENWPKKKRKNFSNFGPSRSPSWFGLN